jgi:hypothetical protein
MTTRVDHARRRRLRDQRIDIRAREMEREAELARFAEEATIATPEDLVAIARRVFGDDVTMTISTPVAAKPGTSSGDAPDDSLGAWTRRLAHTCAACGGRPVDASGVCGSCGASKTVST